MDQVSINYKLVDFSNLVCKNDLVSNLKAIIFIICEQSINKDK
jgi:hypothetical protein